jgi:hypothetical protein
MFASGDITIEVVTQLMDKLSTELCWTVTQFNYFIYM